VWVTELRKGPVKTHNLLRKLKRKGVVLTFFFYAICRTNANLVYLSISRR